MEENNSPGEIESEVSKEKEEQSTVTTNTTIAKPKCIHCDTEMDIYPPYNVNWRSEAWINCPNMKCQRPNKFLFINGGNVTIKNVTKFNSAPTFQSSSNSEDKELGNLMKEVEDSHIHDRNKGAAIVLRVCLEQFVWVRTLKNPEIDANTGIDALNDLDQYLLDNNHKAKEIKESKEAFNFIADLGDTAAHFRLRNHRRVKLATEANLAMAIRKFDRLNEIINGEGS